MKESCWIEAMQEEIHEFERLKVWELVPRPDKVMIINQKWIFKVKLDEYGGVLKNKARLVTKGYRQEEGIDFEESFAPVAYHPTHVSGLKKPLYGLKQAPRDLYDLLYKFLRSQQFIKGAVDPTLFTRKEGEHVIFVQIYVDDIIFAFTYLRLQISQSPRGIFINQSKYALEMLKKYGLDQCNLVDIPMVERPKLDEDPNRTLIDPTRYRCMVGSLMYLTASRPDLVFAVCMCAVKNSESVDHL
ncbi:retrovirus-related pol polyprotein from transposon TNT 1-94 [Tanacetum coccineum]